MKNLLKIDDFLTNYPLQIVLTLIALNNLDNLWFQIGLAIYFLMMIYNFKTNKEELSNMKILFKKEGVLPFLKGFTYSLFLGPLSLGLIYLVRKK